MFCPITSIGSRNLKRKKIGVTIEEKREINIVQKDNPSCSKYAIAHEFNKMHKGENVKHNIMSIAFKGASTIMAINTITSKSKRNKNVMYLGQNMIGASHLKHKDSYNS
jgi:phage terminase small subunit